MAEEPPVYDKLPEPERKQDPVDERIRRGSVEIKPPKNPYDGVMMLDAEDYQLKEASNGTLTKFMEGFSGLTVHADEDKANITYDFEHHVLGRGRFGVVAEVQLKAGEDATAARHSAVVEANSPIKQREDLLPRVIGKGAKKLRGELELEALPKPPLSEDFPLVLKLIHVREHARKAFKEKITSPQRLEQADIQEAGRIRRVKKRDVLREIRCLRIVQDIPSRPFARLYGVWTNIDAVVLLMRKEGPSLYDVTKPGGGLHNLKQRLPKVPVWMQQIESAVAYMHDRSVAHMDLSTKNVVLQGTDRNQELIRIIDFGRAVQGKTHNWAVHLAMTPPEMWEGERSMSHKVDIYHLGLMWWELMNCTLPATATKEEDYQYWAHPFAWKKIPDLVVPLMARGMSESEAMHNVWEQYIGDTAAGHARCAFKKDFESGKAWYRHMKSCLKYDPEQRPTAEQLVQEATGSGVFPKEFLTSGIQTINTAKRWAVARTVVARGYEGDRKDVSGSAEKGDSELEGKHPLDLRAKYWYLRGQSVYRTHDALLEENAQLRRKLANAGRLVLRASRACHDMA